MSERKITARIDEKLYYTIKDNFHYGQQTELFTKIFLSLKEIINDDRFDEITDYLYKGKPITLPAVEE